MRPGKDAGGEQANKDRERPVGIPKTFILFHERLLLFTAERVVDQFQPVRHGQMEGFNHLHIETAEEAAQGRTARQWPPSSL